jgi:arginine:ornithine antiporter/lysine permease
MLITVFVFLGIEGASAPGAILYVIARRERNLRLLRPAEAVLFGIIVLGAIVGVAYLITGAIEI